MPLAKKRIAVVGGGPAGMMAIKSIKEENMEPVCYEKTPHFGGTWRYHDDDVEGLGSTMWTTVINHSKEMGAISDFPPKKEYPNYMRHFELLEMFQEFAKKYDIFRHIHYNREVIKVSKAEDYETSGKWIVKVRNNDTDEITEDTLDAVLVCIGHITYPKMATFPGMEKYSGRVMHTHSLKKVNEFQGQKVVVVGIGCSGLDAAVEISNVAKQVYLSTRSGAWIFPRVGPYGLPLDFALIRRHMFFLQENFSLGLMSSYLESNVLERKFNHNLYNLKPKYHALCKDPSVNDLLPSKLIIGSVVIRKNIKYFTEKGVVFEGEENVTEADAVILATGYTWKFPFLDEDIITTEKNGRINLYKCMFPAQLPHPTLAIIGFLLPFGPGFPLGELQCRWVSHLIANNGRLPCKDAMLLEVKKRHEENVKRYHPSEKMTIRVDFISYLDDIASQFGVKPNFLKMAFRDPKLFKACIFGPCLPYQFRLEGPNRWPGARETILTAYDRMRKPLSGTDRPKKRFISEGFIIKYLLVLLMVSLFLTLIDSNVKYYLIALFLPYFLSWKGFLSKYLFLILLLPFFVTWPGFTKDYLITIFVPLGLTLLTSV